MERKIKPFQFKHFTINQQYSALKVGTDAMLIGALIPQVQAKRILDIGAGTGVVSLMLAQRMPKASIVGVEIDESSIIDCKDNFQTSPWASRLLPVHINIKDFESTQKFDLIVSNPPFYQNNLLGQDQRVNTAKHGGEDFIRVFVEAVNRNIIEHGKVYIVIPVHFESYWTNAFKSIDLHPILKITVYSKPIEKSRLILGYSKDGDLCEKQFTIRNQDGTYTDQYKEATKEFHNRTL